MIPPHLIEQTTRSRRLARLRSYYDGTQYKGKPDFWTGRKANGGVVPMRERAPCINYRLPKSAVQEIVKFTLGEGRFPRVKAEADSGLTETEAQTLATFCAKMAEYCHLQPIWEEVLTYGLATGSHAEVVSLRDGHFVSTLHQAEHCDPVLNAHGDVERITICYRYCKEEYVNGQMMTNHYYYRRDIDALTDTLYEPAECINEEPKWVIASTTAHNLGFCPVNWARNGKLLHAADIDGVSIFEGEDAEIDGLNLALSQRHRGINYWGTPQPWETGVTSETGPGAGVRRGAPSRDSQRDPYEASASSAEQARAAGVDHVWRFENDLAKVGLLETTGKAFEAATLHVNDLKDRLKETMGVVLVNPAEIAGSGDVSAKMLAMLYHPLLATVDNVRARWWPGFFGRSLLMRLRMVATLAAANDILIPGADEVAPILRKFMRDGRWVNPHLTPIWGAHFTPTGKEVKEEVDAARAAEEAGYITKRTAASWVAQHFGVQDVDAELWEAEAAREAEPSIEVDEPTPSNQQPFLDNERARDDATNT